MCARIGGAHAWAHSTNGLGVSGPISGLRAIAMRISPCSRAGGTQMVGTPVERTAASVLLSHTRDTTCPRSCRPRASATTDGQSPPPRALIRATIEWRRATRASGIPVSPQPAMHAKVCCVTEMILPEFQQGMGLFENLHEHKIRPRRVRPLICPNGVNLDDSDRRRMRPVYLQLRNSAWPPRQTQSANMYGPAARCKR